MKGHPMNKKSITAAILTSVFMVCFCLFLVRPSEFVFWIVLGPSISTLTTISILIGYLWWRYTNRRPDLVSIREIERKVLRTCKKQGFILKASGYKLVSDHRKKLSNSDAIIGSVHQQSQRPSFGPMEKILTYSLDPQLDFERLLEIDFVEIKFLDVIKKFRDNRISLQVFQSLSDFVPSWFIEKIKEDIKKDEQVCRSRADKIKYIVNLFGNQHGDYLLIKLHDFVEWYYGTDVDMLPRTLPDEVNLLKRLDANKHSLYHLPIDRNPYKITACKEDEPVSVDFYPELEFFRFCLFRTKMENIDGVFERRRKIKVDKNLFSWAPSFEDDILIMSIHDFDHRSIPYASLLHGIQLIENCQLDWMILTKNVRENSLVPLYVYLYLINMYTWEVRHRVVVPKKVTDLLESYTICKITKKILRHQKFSLPFKIPLSVVVLDLFFRWFR